MTSIGVDTILHRLTGMRFGRLAWNEQLTSEEIAKEWIKANLYGQC